MRGRRRWMRRAVGGGIGGGNVGWRRGWCRGLGSLRRLLWRGRVAVWLVLVCVVRCVGGLREILELGIYA